MKKILSLFSFMFVAGLSHAQTSSENYISSTTCLNEDCTKKIERVQYFDLLGRPKQLVDVKATPQGKDIVTPMVYDELGRQTRNYLPVPQSSSANGNIYPQASGMVAYPIADVTNIYGGEKIFTEKILEKSPLERVLSQKQIGNAWNTKSTTFGYDLNTAADRVKKYGMVTTWNSAEKIYKNTLQYTATEYAKGQLVKNTVTDEDGNTVVEFKDGSGQTVLIRKVISASENADTYYLYNDYKQQVYVIPPLASASALNATAVETLCYQYNYDSKNRPVEKKLPGKGWEYMVYDKADRLVMTQDAVMKSQSKWLMTKYDQFGRVVYTAMLSGGERSGMQAQANDHVIVESRQSDGFTQDGMQIFYTNNYFHVLEKVLTVNYYDTYPSYGFNPPFPSSIMGKTVLSDNSTAQAISTKSLPVMSLVKNIENDNWTKSYSYYDTKGRVIGTHAINHLGGYSKTEIDLDFTGLIQKSKVYHKRLNSDPEKVITQYYEYDSKNRMLVHKHQIDSNPVEILTQNEYNELSQLKTKKVGGTNAASPLQSIDYAYNIQGRLTKINDPKNLNGKLFGYELKYEDPGYSHMGTSKHNGLISEVDWRNANEDVMKRYIYIYDGLKRLQHALYTEPYSTTPYKRHFDEMINYDLNGNIKTLKRRAFPVNGNTATLADDLVYEYTGNRLDKITENSSNNAGYEGGNNTISYDLNGNMKDMLDKGIRRIDYNYLNLANGLAIVQPQSIGLARNTTINYLYRADGTKLRKTNTTSGGRGSSQTTVTVDYLDGFQYENFTGGRGCPTCKTEVAFEQQAYTPSERPIGPIAPVWVLDFVGTSEGFYSFIENRYIYNYRDHLGNVRVSFAKNDQGIAQIRNTNNYYPLGLNHIGGANASSFGGLHSYKYNGKELQETGFYDYGWRQYIPDLGRWNGIDQLAEMYLSTSTYGYVAGNPVSYADVDGRWFNSDGSIDTSGYTPRFTSSRQMRNSFLGISPNDGSGSGIYNHSSQALIDRAFNLGGDWYNTGTGFSSSEGIGLGYDGSYTSLNSGFYNGGIGESIIDIPGVTVTKKAGWGNSLQNHFNSYMNNWYNTGGKANWFVSAAGSGVGAFANRFYIGTARPNAPISFFGRNYYGNGRTFIKSAPMAGVIGKFSFGLGLAMDFRGVINYYRNPNSPNKVFPGKAVINGSMGALGTWGGTAGAIYSLFYFGVDAFYGNGTGWDGVMNDIESAEQKGNYNIDWGTMAPNGA
ncbi:DUF6443 domain-containing protein [Chryseobacterium sp. MYb264]|uniref:DUF6443 domain-containing protein n=1 Tax=Chryseobacterium sp. MYb264 TaxID=2745153 RepID=UPI002E11D001|nr:DUF6443 domain-containing protein [Chryseobacterium sp. MYb264]